MKKVLLLGILSLLSLAQAQPIRADGSSTVYPITQAVAEEFNIIRPDVKVTVAFSGTGGGFKKFCVGETDLQNASRPITKAEMDECRKNGIEYIELPVAFDGLTVVVNPRNTWAQCLTVAELRRIWEPDSKITQWNQVRPNFPNRKLVLYGAGTDSGTFDYFTEAINGKAKAIRKDYFPSEDDNVLVRGVEGNVDAMGFFGYAYYVEEKGKLKALAIDNGKGCVEPTDATINNGTYSPLSRPLFIYVNLKSLNEKRSLQDFINFYLTNSRARTAIRKTGYVLLPDEAYRINKVLVDKRVKGSVFSGLEPGTPLIEVMKKLEAEAK
ncbi:Phosphate-binding protein PstS [Meiothermus luteus]|jgi:phosphate transport system substrate-binding protein|uniref:Phosphate-binding protein n=1 Tax=Meiothermus luteus TaxID=2026184 RepID=A0A399ELX9_9DEIN|nr:PstS family phosphate ABC transporter substrate-binding protein [Meiothermus luteus]RIH84483.1 Phosphate-binding protein PstS [Meiothermus luteus]RMH53777.1 MAG: phosphate ABC transporter substrate-binding protein PstS family protein [Deinococcota bacterium]